MLYRRQAAQSDTTRHCLAPRRYVIYCHKNEFARREHRRFRAIVFRYAATASRHGKKSRVLRTSGLDEKIRQ